ncbi:MAG: LuxR family transcriptional regulator [Pedosphaera sp.]|nr:LuxR family transcriptional regulator [Pedosphaera sp.]
MNVYHRLGLGHSLNEISAALGISYFTTATHLQRIQRKLGAPNRHQLLVAAIATRQACSNFSDYSSLAYLPHCPHF